MKVTRLFEGKNIGMCIQRAKATGRALRQHDPDQFAGTRVIVKQTGMHHHLFKTGRQTF